jgi:hypothetical protein
MCLGAQNGSMLCRVGNPEYTSWRSKAAPGTEFSLQPSLAKPGVEFAVGKLQGKGVAFAHSRLTTHDSRLTTHDSRLTTHDSRLTTHIIL